MWEWDALAPEHDVYVRGKNCDLPGVLQNTKTPQAWKYEKNTKKLPNHPFPVWPQKYEKIPKNCKIGQKMTIFVIFRYFFRTFGAKPEMGDFVIFSYFFVFPGLRGFCIL